MTACASDPTAERPKLLSFPLTSTPTRRTRGDRLGISVCLLVACIAGPNVAEGQLKPRVEAGGVARPVLESQITPHDSLPGIPVDCIDVRTGTPFAYRAQRVLFHGSIDSLWSPDSLRPCLGSPFGMRQSVVPDGSGGAYVGWVDARAGEPDIYLQRFTSTGEISDGWPVDGQPVCTAPLSQYHLDLASDGAGGVFLVWEDFRSGVAGDIYLQRIDESGAVSSGWPSGGQAVCGAGGHQGSPKIVPDGSGGAYLVWQDLRSGISEVYLVHVDESGGPYGGWPEGGASLTGSSAPSTDPAILALDDARAVVGWQRQDASDHLELRVALVGATTPSDNWPPASISLGEGEQLSEVALVRGPSAVIACWAVHASDGQRLRIQRLSHAGSLIAEWSSGGLPLHAGQISLSRPTVLATVDGGGLVFWEDFRDSSQSDIYAKRVTANGGLASGWSDDGVGICLAAGDQFAPMVALTDTVSAIASWSDARAATSGVFLASASVSQLAPKLQRATATPGRAKLVWKATPRSYHDYRVDRRVGELEWAKLGATNVGDSLQIVVDDRTAPEGQQAAYRLVVEIPDGEIYFDEVPLSIPRAPLELALRSARGVGVDRLILVSFALPRGIDARLELMDIAGRRVAEQPVGGLEPGEHQVAFRLRSRIPSGIYFVRLIQGKEARSAKVTYIK